MYWISADLLSIGYMVVLPAIPEKPRAGTEEVQEESPSITLISLTRYSCAGSLWWNHRLIRSKFKFHSGCAMRCLSQSKGFASGQVSGKRITATPITLGMAPGGIIKVWIGGSCLDFKEVGRYQAKVEPLGPYRGASKGKYVPLKPENKAYIDQHGIPYGSW